MATENTKNEENFLANLINKLDYTIDQKREQLKYLEAFLDRVGVDFRLPDPVLPEDGLISNNANTKISLINERMQTIYHLDTLIGHAVGNLRNIG